MHADKAGASEAEYDALHFEACLAEVDQQAQVQTGRLEIIHALRAVNIVEHSDRLQLNEHCTLDQQIDRVFSGNNAIVSDHHAVLLQDRKAVLAQFMSESILIDLLKKSRSKRVENGERASDDTLGHPIERDFICVHLRASAVPYSSFGLSQPKLANSLTHPPSRRARRRA